MFLTTFSFFILFFSSSFIFLNNEKKNKKRKERKKIKDSAGFEPRITHFQVRNYTTTPLWTLGSKALDLQENKKLWCKNFEHRILILTFIIPCSQILHHNFLFSFKSSAFVSNIQSGVVVQFHTWDRVILGSNPAGSLFFFQISFFSYLTFYYLGKRDRNLKKK